MDTRVALPVRGMCSSMMVSVRMDPMSPPVPRRCASASDNPVRESEPTRSQLVPLVAAMCWGGSAATRLSRLSSQNVPATASTSTTTRVQARPERQPRGRSRGSRKLPKLPQGDWFPAGRRRCCPCWGRRWGARWPERCWGVRRPCPCRWPCPAVRGRRCPGLCRCWPMGAPPSRPNCCVS